MATSSEASAASAARRKNPPIATPPLDTAGAAKSTKRYSYSDTPMEMQAPRFNYPVTSPTNSTIDESPITPASPASRVLPIYTEPATAHAMVKEEKERARGQLQQPPPPQGMHPAYFAPYREESQRQQPQQSRQQQQQQQQPQHQNAQHEVHAPTENGTMPGVNITAPTPQSPNSPPHPLSASQPPPPPLPNGTNGTAYLKPSQQKRSSEPQKPPRATTTPAATVIVPDASYPPPPTAANHGQAHRDPNHPSSSSFSASPSANKSRHWRHSLCDPSPTCCLSLLLPCLIYGKTQHRLNRKFAGEDPTNLLGYEACNGACGLFALACGLQGLLAALQRGRVRKAYGIEGDMATDCFKGWCCCCCVVGQDEREMKTREEERMGNATKTTTTTTIGGGAYASPMGQMAYAPPPKVAV